jgi:hypothetical protein
LDVREFFIPVFYKLFVKNRLFRAIARCRLRFGRG